MEDVEWGRNMSQPKLHGAVMELGWMQLTGGSKKGKGAFHVGDWGRLHDKLVATCAHVPESQDLLGLKYGIGIADEVLVGLNLRIY